MGQSGRFWRGELAELRLWCGAMRGESVPAGRDVVGGKSSHPVFLMHIR